MIQLQIKSLARAWNSEHSFIILELFQSVLVFEMVFILVGRPKSACFVCHDHLQLLLLAITLITTYMMTSDDLCQGRRSSQLANRLGFLLRNFVLHQTGSNLHVNCRTIDNDGPII